MRCRTLLVARSAMLLVLLPAAGCLPQDYGAASRPEGIGEILDNPRVGRAVDDSGFLFFDGSAPPDIEGSYHPVVGWIVRSAHARPAGTRIDSEGVCFFDQTPTGTIAYVEYGKDQAQGSYIAGEGDRFTVFLEGPTAWFVLSGSSRSDGLRDVSALLVYRGPLEPQDGSTPPPGAVPGGRADEDVWELQELDLTLAAPDCRPGI